MEKKLSDKQERFCREYILDLNAGAAAIRAGYSRASAETNGPRMLRTAQIRERVAQLQAPVAKKLEISADFVLGELLKLASVDISKAYGQNGKLLPLHEIPEEVRKAVGAIETYQDDSGGVVHKLKFWDKNKALTALGQHLKLFQEAAANSQQSVKIVIEDYRIPTVKPEGKNDK